MNSTHRRLAACALAVAVAVAVAVGAVAATGSAFADRSPVPVDDRSDAAASPYQPLPVKVPFKVWRTVGGGLDIVFDGEHIWHATIIGLVTKRDPVSGDVVAEIQLDNYDLGMLTFDGAHVWLTGMGSDTVVKIDPDSATIVDTFDVGPSPHGVVSDGTHVWTAGSHGLTKISATTGELVGHYAEQYKMNEVTFDGTSIWATTLDGVIRVDATTGSTTGEFWAGADTRSVRAVGGQVWVADDFDTVVRRLDPTTGEVVGEVDVFDAPLHLDVAGGLLWVATKGGHVVAIDPVDSQVVEHQKIDAELHAVTFDGQQAWAATMGGPIGGIYELFL